MLGFVFSKGAAEVRASFCCREQHIRNCYFHIFEQLRAEHISVWVKNRLVYVLFAGYHISKDLRRRDGCRHSPKIKSRRNIYVRHGGAVSADIRYSVKSHAVLVLPSVLFFRLWKMPFCEIFNRMVSAALLPVL